VKLTDPVAPLLSSNSLSRFIAEQGFEQPKRVRVLPQRDSAKDQCYVNVLDGIARSGGLGIYGWKILEFRGLFFQAIHHAIWQARTGRMLDVTPDVRRWKQHVFTPSTGTPFNGVPPVPVPPRTLNISGLKEVDEALAIFHELTAMRLKQLLPNGMIPAIDNTDPLVNELSNRAMALLAQAQAKVSAQCG
jgi:hypothetical protein